MTDIICISPIDGREVARRAAATTDAIDAALKRARAAQRDWARRPIEQRAEFCTRAVDAMLTMGADIARELALQMGRPVRYGAGEMRGFAERARHMIAIAADALAPIVPPARLGFTRSIRREPLGLVLTIAPWNYPYLTAVNSIVPALMAGNGVLLKHAAQTLLVGERFQRAFDEAGLPEGLFQNLFLTHEQTTTIIASRGVDHVCFTGSVAAGRAIERAAAGAFIGVGLELGGKDPAYVRADANLAHAIETLTDGAFFNAGQSCCGIKRIYVAAPRYDDFVSGVIELTQQYRLGSPLDPLTTIGPVVRTAAADALREQVKGAVAGGARQLIDEASITRCLSCARRVSVRWSAS
jgi:acyl-CoA reductase-like NAD-dependent aldehyde dehydrogenase